MVIIPGQVIGLTKIIATKLNVEIINYHAVLLPLVQPDKRATFKNA